MKLLVISDLHANNSVLDKMDNIFSEADAVLFAGDFAECFKPETGTEALKRLCAKHDSIFAVLGNCDNIDFLEERLFAIAEGLPQDLPPAIGDNNSNCDNFLLDIREYPLSFWETHKGKLTIGGAGLALLVYTYNKFKNRNQKIEKTNAVNWTKITPAKTQKLVLKQ